MPNQILYLGDGSLATAAGYLAGVLSHFELAFDYISSDVPATIADIQIPRRLFVLSDYAANMLDTNLQQAMLEQVRGGAGLLMIGGWESYCGLGGDWAGTPVADALPVNVSTTDDRINYDQPALLIKKTDHPILGDLPWTARTPVVGGFNRVTAKPTGTVLLDVQRFSSSTTSSGNVVLKPLDRHPMLTVGTLGNGRVAALATDLAPHWVGGFVDWGTQRISAQAPGSWRIEVGNLYASFIRNLITWTGNI